MGLCWCSVGVVGTFVSPVARTNYFALLQAVVHFVFPSDSLQESSTNRVTTYHRFSAKNRTIIASRTNPRNHRMCSRCARWCVIYALSVVFDSSQVDLGANVIQHVRSLLIGWAVTTHRVSTRQNSKRGWVTALSSAGKTSRGVWILHCTVHKKKETHSVRHNDTTRTPVLAFDANSTNSLSVSLLIYFSPTQAQTAPPGTSRHWSSPHATTSPALSSVAASPCSVRPLATTPFDECLIHHVRGSTWRPFACPPPHGARARCPAADCCPSYGGWKWRNRWTHLARHGRPHGFRWVQCGLWLVAAWQ